MLEADPGIRELFDSLDRFLQWDLVTVTPWGAPAIAPVGARLIPQEGTVWTSTTVGYAAKVRNIEAHPRVALMRTLAGEPSVLIRGEARVVAGDGTANLAQLFRMMGGAGGARRFFATSATDPFWSRLYRAYWRRFLIAVRIVEISRMGPQGWQSVKVASWTQPEPSLRAPTRRPRLSRTAGLVDGRGRAMLEAGTPAALATVRKEGAAPMIWPVRARPGAGEEIQVDAGFSLPSGRLPHSSLAVRVIDDSFGVAQLAGWIGALEQGAGVRLLRPRATYGFTKPPGIVGDLAAGVAALVKVVGLPHDPEVSSPDLARAVELGGAAALPPPQLSEPAWILVERIFARRNAAAIWYAAMAALARDRRLSRTLTILAERAQLERDWAHGVLTRGSRRVGAVRLATGALAGRPNPTGPESAAVREEAETGRLLGDLQTLLPPEVIAPPERTEAAFQSRPGSEVGRRGQQGFSEATLAAATAFAAAADRWHQKPTP
ncbi:MAG: pyridoxamine 5'-phosphate oxidase family protein [Candidatus Dormibacteria bacterium]